MSKPKFVSGDVWTVVAALELVIHVVALREEKAGMESDAALVKALSEWARDYRRKARLRAKQQKERELKDAAEQEAKAKRTVQALRKRRANRETLD